jgi:hypothetical protein
MSPLYRNESIDFRNYGIKAFLERIGFDVFNYQCAKRAPSELKRAVILEKILKDRKKYDLRIIAIARMAQCFGG